MNVVVGVRWSAVEVLDEFGEGHVCCERCGLKGGIKSVEVDV
jgi:hypothetical protein